MLDHGSSKTFSGIALGDVPVFAAAEVAGALAAAAIASALFPRGKA